MHNGNYPVKRREQMLLVLIICLTGVFILVPVKLTIVVLKQIQKSKRVAALLLFAQPL